MLALEDVLLKAWANRGSGCDLPEYCITLWYWPALRQKHAALSASLSAHTHTYTLTQHSHPFALRNRQNRSEWEYPRWGNIWNRRWEGRTCSRVIVVISDWQMLQMLFEQIVCVNGLIYLLERFSVQLSCSSVANVSICSNDFLIKQFYFVHTVQIYGKGWD